MRAEVQGRDMGGPIVRGVQGTIAPRDALAIHLHPQERHHGRHQRSANKEERKYL